MSDVISKEQQTVSLKEYFDAEVKNIKLLISNGSQEAKDAVKAALDSQKEAVLKSEAATEKRFQSVNEFRAQLGDQSRTLMPRSEVEVIIKSIEGKIDALQTRLDKSEGKGAGVGQVVGYVVGGFGILIAIASLLLKFIK